VSVRTDSRRLRTWLGILALVGYDAFVRPRMCNWGATARERGMALPGDEIFEDVMTHNTRALTIHAPPEGVWPWLVQIGDHRAGFYSYDWIERWLFPGTVHYIERTHSATRIHPELQDLKVGDRVDTGSLGSLRIGSPVTILDPNHVLVIGSWSFVLQRLPDDTTRLLVRERDRGWMRAAVPRRFGLLRAVGGLIDYLIGEPLHFLMMRGMMLGLKERTEGAAGVGGGNEPPDLAEIQRFRDGNERR